MTAIVDTGYCTVISVRTRERPLAPTIPFRRSSCRVEVPRTMAKLADAMTEVPKLAEVRVMALQRPREPQPRYRR